MARLFNITPSAAKFELWLRERSKMVVPETFEISQSTIEVLDTNYQFPSSEIPEFKVGKSVTPGGTVKTVMSNIGAGLYLASKQSGALLGINIPGIGKIAATSPRIGLFKIGEGQFMPLLRKSGGTDFESYANSLSRLAVFFHEARHSDGNGKSLGFLHAICPEDHNFAGYNACDENLNGPYTLGAAFLKSVVNDCTQCTDPEKEALRNVYMDSFARIIAEVPVTISPEIASANDTIRQTCASLVNLKIDISSLDSCKNIVAAATQAAPPVIKSVALDPTPEIGPAFGGN